MKPKHSFRAFSQLYKALSNLHVSICFYLICILSLSACSNIQYNEVCDNCSTRNSNNFYASDYICHKADVYAGQVIGDGHCVSFIKQCTNALDTNNWRPGNTVWRNNIQIGSVIATFKNSRYPNISGYHAAIYIKQDSQGIWVWDQWQGKAVHQRLIRWRNDNATDANTAQSYKTVLSKP